MSPKTWFRLLGLSCLLIAIGFAVPALTQGAKKGKSHALLVGVKDYTRATLGKLNYTENDVEELAKVLDRPGSPFYKNVRVLTCTRGKKDKDDVPTAANIAKALAALVKGKKDGDTVLVALAGHGIQLSVRDPKNKGKEKGFAYFCPQDADLPGADYETGRHEHMVLLSDLLGDLGDCGAGTKLLLMDACRNERTARSLRLNKELVPDGVAALFSCKTGQFAFESSKLGKGHGVFFHHVIKALEGEAKDKQGRVTWGRLVEHVTDRVVEEVPKVIGDGASQTPHEIKNFAGRSPVLVSGLKSDDSGKDTDGGTKVVVDSPKDKSGKEPIVKGFLDKEGKNSIGMKFVLVKKGKFTMGSPKGEKDRNTDEDEHEVEITKDFHLGVHEVTQKQYKAIMGTNPSWFSADGKGADKVKGLDTDDFPVENVSWQDTQAFLKILNARAAEKEKGRVYRLPSEAEWEYACRGGVSSKKYHFGDSISSDDANFDNKLGRTSKVGSYAANKFGLHDMHGNVYEWCEDWYDDKFYANSPARDPLNLKAGSFRVIRGGGWSSTAGNCRSASRNGSDPGSRSSDLGFRVALVPAR